MAKLKASNRVIVPTGDIPFEGEQSMGLNKLVNLSPATNPADAVRFDQLTTGTSPVSGVDLEGSISGLNYKMDAANPTTKIVIEPGYCFDSTGSKQLFFDTEITKNITIDWSLISEGGKAVGSQILGSGQMWHVFIIGNDSGQVSIVLDDNIDNTNIQGDYIYHRWLGYLWTKNDGISTDLVEFWMSGNKLMFDGINVPWVLNNTPITTSYVRYDLSIGAPMSKINDYNVGRRSTSAVSGEYLIVSYLSDVINGDAVLFQHLGAPVDGATPLYTKLSTLSTTPIPSSLYNPYIRVSIARNNYVNIPTVTLKR